MERSLISRLASRGINLQPSATLTAVGPAVACQRPPAPTTRIGKPLSCGRNVTPLRRGKWSKASPGRRRVLRSRSGQRKPTSLASQLEAVSGGVEGDPTLAVRKNLGESLDRAYRQQVKEQVSPSGIATGQVYSKRKGEVSGHRVAELPNKTPKLTDMVAEDSTVRAALQLCRILGTPSPGKAPGKAPVKQGVHLGPEDSPDTDNPSGSMSGSRSRWRRNCLNSPSSSEGTQSTIYGGGGSTSSSSGSYSAGVQGEARREQVAPASLLGSAMANNPATRGSPPPPAFTPPSRQTPSPAPFWRVADAVRRAAAGGARAWTAAAVGMSPRPSLRRMSQSSSRPPARSPAELLFTPVQGGQVANSPSAPNGPAGSPKELAGPAGIPAPILEIRESLSPARAPEQRLGRELFPALPEPAVSSEERSPVQSTLPLPQTVEEMFEEGIKLTSGSLGTVVEARQLLEAADTEEGKALPDNNTGLQTASPEEVMLDTGGLEESKTSPSGKEQQSPSAEGRGNDERLPRAVVEPEPSGESTAYSLSLEATADGVAVAAPATTAACQTGQAAAQLRRVSRLGNVQASPGAAPLRRRLRLSWTRRVKAKRESSAPQLSFNSVAETCSICCEEAIPAQGAVRLACQHGWYCSTCVTRHVQARLDIGAVSVPCPQCEVPIAEHHLRKVVPEELINKMLERSLEQAVSQQADLYSCPTPNCPMRVFLEDGESGRLKCPLCKKTSCVRCGAQPFHRGMTCEKFAACQRAKVEEEQLMRWMQETGTKQCPTCRMAVTKQNLEKQNTQRTECHKMMCRNCNTKFCFKCCAVLTASYSCGCTIDDHGFINPKTGRRVSHLRAGIQKANPRRK